MNLRRAVFSLSFFCGLFCVPLAAGAQARHGLSVFGDLAYSADFAHFAYVNPQAPKGGLLSQTGAPSRIPNASPLTFDSFNGYILKGNGAQGLEMTSDSLMTRAYDEPDAVYGLVAQNVLLSKDARRALFTLRPRARFHDGAPLTAEDVAFSLMLLKQNGHPLIASHLRHLELAAADPKGRLRLRLSAQVKTRIERMRFWLLIAQLPIFSKTYYAKHDFTKTTLMPPLGSGPYQVNKFKAGRFITYQRVKNYWARDLPVNKGRWNFDQIKFEYFRDRNSEFEAFKAGVYQLREEYTSKVWARQYDFPAMLDGRVKKLKLPDRTPSGAQGWFINMRREKFRDLRVREALGLAFDFGWTNRNQFYNIYRRTESFFENSKMKAQGRPHRKELALLVPWRENLPSSVFGTAIEAPRSDGSGQDRRLLRRAAQLLKNAGWVIKNGRRQNSQGQILTIEFLNDTPSFERIVQPYIKNLRLLGIEAVLRIVDAAQYQQRLRQFDFDITTRRYTMPSTPGIELKNYFSSALAHVPGSLNISGVEHKAVDALIARIIAASSRAEQLYAVHALDRILRALYIWVPQWHNVSHHIAYWDIYERPKNKPDYARGILDTWWAKPSARAASTNPASLEQK